MTHHLRSFAVALVFVTGAASAAWSQVPDSFDPGSNDYIYAIAVQPDGKILVGGNFTMFGCYPNCGGGAIPRSKLARLNTDGTVDATFDPGVDGPVYGILVQPDGKIVIGGQFFNVGGGGTGNTARKYLARLNADGTVDPTFNPGTNMNNSVVAMALQPDGKILVGGNFYAGLAGGVRYYFGRLNADGSLDAGFSPGFDGPVYTVAVQPDGKILVGGLFLNMGGQFGDTARSRIGRLNSDGTVDMSFDPGANQRVDSIAVQGDGKILVGGYFTGLGGSTGSTPRSHIGRLNADGSLDAGFDPGADDIIFAFASQTDGRIIVGGAFITLGGGGTGSTTRNGIARLNTDGSVDGTFDPNANSQVNALAVQPDGKVLVAGTFATIGGGPRYYLARLLNSAAATQSITAGAGGTTLTWSRGGTGSEVWRVEFASSTDSVNYTALGAGTRVAGGWEITGVSLPVNPNLTVRARGYYSTGWAGASSSIVEYIVPMPNFNVINNGTFTAGSSGWSQFAVPSNGMVSQVTNGVFQFYRTGTQAVIFSNTSVAFPTNAPIYASFDLGNTAGTKKRISVLIHEADFSDLSVCTFWLPANAPLTTYVMTTHTTKPWTSLNISFYAASLGSAGTGFYELDNVLVQYSPAGSTTETVCDDVLNPTPPGGAAGPNLLTNGDFGTGNLTPWFTFGNITSQITGGVFEFIKTTAAAPAGVVAQATGQGIAANQILTASFQLGNSSAVRKRVTILIHDNDFSDLSACTFWLAPGQPLSTYTYRTFTGEAWTNLTFSVYPATVGAESWIRLDNVILQATPGGNLVGTHCIEPGGTVPDTVAPGAWGPGLVRTTAPETAAEPTADWRADGFADAGGPTGGAWVAAATTAGRRVLQLAEPIDLAHAASAMLRLRSWLTAAASHARIEVSVDGAAWDTLVVVTPSDDWVPLELDLAAYLGDLVHVRFVLDTAAVDGGAPDAWRIEDVDVGP